MQVKSSPHGVMRGQSPVQIGAAASKPQDRSLEAQDLSVQKPFKIAGLDLSALGNGIVKIKASLNRGTFSFLMPHEDAVVRIRKSTVAQVSFGITTRANSPGITGANITFSPPITIKNPSASLKPSQGPLARLIDVDYLKDKVADVVICGIHVAKDGQLHVDGYLKLGLFSKKKLSDVLKPNDLPKVGKDSNQTLKLDSLLKDLGLVLGDATFSVEAHSNQSRKLELEAFGVKAWTEEASAHTKVRGQARLTRNNSVHFNVDQNQTSVRFGATQGKFGGEIRIADLDSTGARVESHIAYQIKPNQVHATVRPSERKEITLALDDGENEIRGHAFVFRDKDGHVSVKDASNLAISLGAHATGPIQVGTEKLYGQLHAAKAQVNLKANFCVDENGLGVSAGEASANLSASDFEAIYQGLDVSAPGNYRANFNVPLWQYASGSANPSALGSANLSFEPSSQSRANLPAMRALDSHLRFTIRGDGTAQADHVRKGVTEFLKPFCDLNPQENTPSITPGVGCSTIGSTEFQRRCEIIAGTKIRRNNSAELLIDGVASLPKRLALINSAQKSICMQTMVFKDDKTGAQIAKALCDAVARGVDVKVIVDALGNATSFQEVLMMNPIYVTLARGGVQLELHNNSIGEGLTQVFGAISKSSKLKEIFNLDDLSNPQKIFEKLHVFAKGALGRADLGLGESDTILLAQGLSRILGGEKSSVRTDLLEHLATITEDNVLELSEILEFIKNNAHLNNRWHEKYLVVDYNEAIVGGVNTADEYLLGGTGAIVTVEGKTSEAWRDTDVYLKGEAARDAFTHFADNFKELTGKSLVPGEIDESPRYGDTQVQMVHSRPNIDKRSRILDLTVEALGSLTKGEKAYFENAYFVPSGRALQLEDALIAASKRGVDVRVLMNSEKSIDVKEVAHAAVFSQRRLLEGGVRIFERTSDQMLHSKVAVFGSKVAAVGSWNGDNRASSLNCESSAFVHDAKFAEQTERMLIDDMKKEVAREVHLSDIAFLPLKTEATNTLQAMMSDQL